MVMVNNWSSFKSSCLWPARFCRPGWAEPCEHVNQGNSSSTQICGEGQKRPQHRPRGHKWRRDAPFKSPRVSVHVTKPVLIQPRELSHFRLPNSAFASFSTASPRVPFGHLWLVSFSSVRDKPPHVCRPPRAAAGCCGEELYIWICTCSVKAANGWMVGWLLEITNYARQVARKRNFEQIVFSRNAH